MKTQRKSFKNTLSLRKSIETKTIEGLMGYSPHEFGKELLRQATEKWEARKNHTNFPEKNKDYVNFSHSFLISWDTMRFLNLLECPCKVHEGERLSLKHLRDVHGLPMELDMGKLLFESKSLHAELKTSNTSKRRKGRIYCFAMKLKVKHKKCKEILALLRKPTQKIKK